MFRLVGSRSVVRVGSVLAAMMAIVLGVAQPSFANSGTISGSNSQGTGSVSWSTGTYLTVNINAKDTSCNGKGFQTLLTIHMDGVEDPIYASGETREGCNTNGGYTRSYTASELKGKRSGYLEIALCHKVVIGWSCGGTVNSAFWSF